MFTQNQLGWNCFDVAVGIKRQDLVRFALENSSSLEFRQLLAPEIRHAAAIATLEINTEDVDNSHLLSLLTTLPGSDKKQIVSLKQKLPTQGLPAKMWTPVLQKLLNDYANAFEKLRPFAIACNDALFRKDGNRLSIDELDEYPKIELQKYHSFFYFPAYQIYQKARAKILTPIEKQLFEYSLDEAIFRQYVEHYYGAQEWVAFHRQFAGEHSTSMVDIAARMLSVNIIILQPSEAGLEEIYRTTNFSLKNMTVVFNGHNHFWSYVDYVKQNPKLHAASHQDLAIITEKMAKLKLSKQITVDDLVEMIKNLLADYAEMTKINNSKISVQLKARCDEVRFYLNHSYFVLKASYLGSLETIKDKYGNALLQINLHLSKSKIVTTEEAKKIYRGFGLLAKHYKEKRAYTDIYKGLKNIKAGLGHFDAQKSVNQPNPIATQSKKNIRKLIIELQSGSTGIVNKFGLRSDEVELLKALLNLPLRMQHATNYYYPALNAGALDSYTELKRRDPEYKSPFSTKGNIDKLGNGGFIFFRVYVDPINSQNTRYGKTTLIFDLNLLRSSGWISLHDQLKPFPSKNTRRFYSNKRLLRTSEEIDIQANTSDKNLYDGLRYNYRTSSITSYDKGTLDTQKSFGKTITIVTREQSFLEEIFFGEDIVLGIALSVIRELRYLERCGYRQGFITLFNRESEQNKTLLLGNLIKELFRIEGKYPVSLRIQANIEDKTQTFSEYINSQNKLANEPFEVINPDGDGRYNMDNSTNTEAGELAFLDDRSKFIEDRLHITRSQAARVKEGSPQKQKWTEETQKLEDEQRGIQQWLTEDRETRQELIRYFVDLFEVGKDRFVKIDTHKLKLLREKFDFVLEDDSTELEEILSVSTQQLIIMSQESYYDLLEKTWVKFSELAECTLQQLENLAKYDLDKPFSERNMTISELVMLYDENPMHLTCLTCDDLTDLVLENAPYIDSIIRTYAEEEGVDFAWVLEQLCESEQMLFRQNLGWDEEEPEVDNDSHEDYEDYHDDIENQDLTDNNFDEDTDFSDNNYDELYSDDNEPEEDPNLDTPDRSLNESSTGDFTDRLNKLSLLDKNGQNETGFREISDHPEATKTNPSVLHQFNKLAKIPFTEVTEIKSKQQMH